MTLTATIPNDLETVNIAIALFDNLTAAGYTVSSGTLQVTGSGDNATIDANLVTSQGVVDLTLTVQRPNDTTTVISTASPGTHCRLHGHLGQRDLEYQRMRRKLIPAAGR